MVVLEVTWDGIVLLFGLIALLYTIYLRDLIFQRKIHREIDLRSRTLHPAQRFIETSQSILWKILIVLWMLAILSPSSRLHGTRLISPGIIVTLSACVLMSLFFFLMNHARSTLESFASWRLGCLESERTELVTDSIYFFCRHPFTLFSILMALSMWLLAPFSTSLVLIGVLAFATHVENMFEEEILLRQHPEYARYSRQVHCYWPGSLEKAT